MSIIWIIVALGLGGIVYVLLNQSGGGVMVRRQYDALVARYGRYVNRSVLVPVIVLAVLGILMRDLLLTTFLLAMAGWMGYQKVQLVIKEKDSISQRDISQLVLAFRSSFEIVSAPFASLGLIANRIDDPLRQIILDAIEAYFASENQDVAFDMIRSRCDDPLLHQFVYILEMSEVASKEAVMQSLDALHTRMQRQEEIERQVETGLSGITGQTSFMLGLAVFIAYAIALVPSMRVAYTSSLMSRIGYMVLVGIIMLTSNLIDNKNRSLKEQIA